MKHGDDLGVHLGGLYKIANVYLPAVAEPSLDANKKLGGLPSAATSAVLAGDGSRRYHSDSAQRYYGLWDALCSKLQEVIADHVDNIDAAADTLLQIAENYVNADESARQAMLHQSAVVREGNPNFFDSDGTPKDRSAPWHTESRPPYSY